MENTKEPLHKNPHLLKLLGQRGLTLKNTNPGCGFYSESPSGFGVFANTGMQVQEGTIVGSTETHGIQLYVIYDETKEGEDDALTLKIIT